jgi:hypothetical protein
VDGRPAANAGAIHAEPVFETAEIEFADRVRYVVLQARDIRESQVDLFRVVGFGEL